MFTYNEAHEGSDVVGEMMGRIRGVGEIAEGEKVTVGFEMAVMSGRKKAD